MPRLSNAVSDLRKVEMATAGDLTHKSPIRNIAKQCVDYGHRLTCPQLYHMVVVTRAVTEQPRQYINWNESQPTAQPLDKATIQDATFMGQPAEPSQRAYASLRSTTDLYDGEAKTHLLDGCSNKNHRNTNCTQARATRPSARVLVLDMCARTRMHDIEQGLRQQ